MAAAGLRQTLVLEPSPAGPRGALLDDRGRLLRLVEEEPDGVVDRLFLARVRRVEPALEAAFLDIGTPVAAWLSARDARHTGAAGEALPIGRRVQEGEALLVQGRRGAHGDKGPRVTTDIQLAGLFLVFRPRGEGIEPSRRIAPERRRALRERAREVLGQGGFVLRTAAAAVEEPALAAEAALLRRRWQALEAAAGRARPPARLDDGTTPLERLLVEALAPDLARIVTGDPALALQAARFLEARWPALALRIERVAGSAFDAMGVADELALALASAVPLAGGGRLVIEPTAACVAIDVDGGPRGRREALALNLEAAAEAARQIRLRELAGTIVIDFVAMANQGNRRKLLHALRAALGEEPGVGLHAVPALGLVAVTRQRRGASLAERQQRRSTQAEQALS